MSVRSAVFAFALAALAACQQAPRPQTPGLQASPPTSSDEPPDPFVVMISAERWTVLLDKALEGTQQAPEPSAGIAETDQARADRATKDGAAMLLRLRNALCAKGMLRGDDCLIRNWPAWASEPPNPDTPLAVIDARSSWLGEAMQAFVGKGCEAGEAAFMDDMFCSVE